MGMGLYDAVFATLTRLYGTAARKPITGITLTPVCQHDGWPISAYLDVHFGWRTVCLVWAAVHLLLALPLNLTLPRARRGASPPTLLPAEEPVLGRRRATRDDGLRQRLLTFSRPRAS